MNQAETVRHAYRTGTKATLSDGTVINTGRKKDPALGEIKAKKYEVDKKSDTKKSESKQTQVVQIEGPDYSKLIRSESEKSLVMLDAQRKLIEELSEALKNRQSGDIIVDIERGKDKLINRFIIKVS